MATVAGPNIVQGELIFCIDASGPKGTSPLGNNLFNGAPSLVNNLVASKENVGALNETHIGGLDFYTIFAIDYPESSFGGNAASRDGITPGLNVRSGTKTFDYGRALHYSVYDNITQTFVKNTIYDSYVGTDAVDTFVSEYSSSINAYPDATHIVAGSHRDSYHTTSQYEILRDLGAPSNVDSIIGFSSPEWILVGKPGLGAGNAYGWVFQNYTTDSTKVAHLNVGLPIYKNTENYFAFDGTDDYLELNTKIIPATGAFTMEFLYQISTTGGRGGMFERNPVSPYNGALIGQGGSGSWYFQVSNGSQSLTIDDMGYPSTNTWYHDVGVYDGVNTIKFYRNGSLHDTVTGSTIGNIDSGGTRDNMRYMKRDSNSGTIGGKIAISKVYSKALSNTEVKQNFNALKNRFDI